MNYGDYEPWQEAGEPVEWEAVEDFCTSEYFLFKAAAEAEARDDEPVFEERPPMTQQRLEMLKRVAEATRILKDHNV